MNDQRDLELVLALLNPQDCEDVLERVFQEHFVKLLEEKMAKFQREKEELKTFYREHVGETNLLRTPRNHKPATALMKQLEEFKKKAQKQQQQQEISFSSEVAIEDESEEINADAELETTFSAYTFPAAVGPSRPKKKAAQHVPTPARVVLAPKHNQKRVTPVRSTVKLVKSSAEKAKNMLNTSYDKQVKRWPPSTPGRNAAAAALNTSLAKRLRIDAINKKNEDAIRKKEELMRIKAEKTKREHEERQRRVDTKRQERDAQSRERKRIADEHEAACRELRRPEQEALAQKRLVTKSPFRVAQSPALQSLTPVAAPRFLPRPKNAPVVDARRLVQLASEDYDNNTERQTKKKKGENDHDIAIGDEENPSKMVSKWAQNHTEPVSMQSAVVTKKQKTVVEEAPASGPPLAKVFPHMSFVEDSLMMEPPTATGNDEEPMASASPPLSSTVLAPPAFFASTTAVAMTTMMVTEEEEEQTTTKATATLNDKETDGANAAANTTTTPMTTTAATAAVVSTKTTTTTTLVVIDDREDRDGSGDLADSSAYIDDDDGGGGGEHQPHNLVVGEHAHQKQAQKQQQTAASTTSTLDEDEEAEFASLMSDDYDDDANEELQKKKAKKHHEDDDYDIADLTSGAETDDEENPRKVVPKWAEKPASKAFMKSALEKHCTALHALGIGVERVERHYGHIRAPSIGAFFNDFYAADPQFAHRHTANQRQQQQHNDTVSTTAWDSPLEDPRPGVSRYPRRVNRSMAPPPPPATTSSTAVTTSKAMTTSKKSQAKKTVAKATKKSTRKAAAPKK